MSTPEPPPLPRPRVTQRGDSKNTEPASHDGDAQLVQAAQLGDRAALERLLRDNYERIYTLCRRMCRSREQAEDATQNALMAIVRGLGNFDGRSRFSTWSYRVATNSTLDELRRAAKHKVVSLHADVSSSEGAGKRQGTGGFHDVGATDNWASSTQTSRPFEDPSESVVSTETRKHLGEALDSLDERFRVPLVLRDVAELDYSEIAALLDLPPGTVRSRISRGRRHLGQILAGTDLDPAANAGDDPIAGSAGVAESLEVNNRPGPPGNPTDRKNVRTDET